MSRTFPANTSYPEHRPATRIETAGIPSPRLAEYATVPIAFEVISVLSAQQDPAGSFVLTERRLEGRGDGPL